MITDKPQFSMNGHKELVRSDSQGGTGSSMNGSNYRTDRRMAQVLVVSALAYIVSFVIMFMISISANAADKYRFSPVNQWDITKTAGYWNPIINYVSDKSEVSLELKIGRTSADTTSYVLAQEVEFIFSNHLFSPEREKLGWKVLVADRAP